MPRKIENAEFASVLAPGLHLVLARTRQLARDAMDTIDAFAERRCTVYETLPFETLHARDLDERVRTFLHSTRTILATTMRESVVDQLASLSDLRVRVLFADDRGNPCWMTEDEAAMVQSALEVGIEQLSEILLTRGLW